MAVRPGKSDSRQLRLSFNNESNVHDNEMEDSGIYNAFRPTVIFGNLFGLIPLTNSTKPRTKNIKFKWISIQTAFSFFIWCWLAWNAISANISFVLTPVGNFSFSKSAANAHNPLFYTSATLSFILTFNLTRKLPTIFKQWDEAVKRLQKYQLTTNSTDQLDKWKTTNNGCRISAKWSMLISLIFFSSAIIEHCFHDFMEFNKKHCRQYKCKEASFIFCCLSPMNDFTKRLHGPNEFAVVASYITQKFATVSWNFHDLLLIQLGSALNVNFKVFTNYVKRMTENRHLSTLINWKTLREDHVALCEVVRVIDDAISAIVLFSYGVNVYFVAIQIYFGVHLENRSWIEICYIITSFGHIVGRMIAVTLTASNFCEQANVPLTYLMHVPSDVYNREIKRYSDHLSGSKIGFTGWKMFLVNRQLFLAILSLIVTYELLLLDTE